MAKLLKAAVLISGLLLLFFWTPSYASWDSLPIITVTKTKVPPVVDGRMEPGEWKYATATTGFVNVGGTLTRDDTIVYITYDEENLYIAFRSTVSGGIKAKVTKHDGPVYTDDAIEIRLAPDPSRPRHFYTFIGNSIGTTYDAIVTDASWNGSWKFRNSVVDVGETAGGILTFGRSIWTAEIAIPFKALGVSAPRDGSLWRGNFSRDWDISKKRKAKQGAWMAKWTSWSPSGGNFNNSEGFGYLYFRKDAPVIKIKSLGDPAGGDIDIRGKISNFSSSTLSLKSNLLVSLARTKKEIIKREIPLAVNPHKEKALKIKESLKLSKSLPISLGLAITDATGKNIFYKNNFYFISRPSFRLDAALLYSQEEVLVNWDIKRLPTLSPTSSALAEVYTPRDNILIASFPLKGLNNKNRTGTYPLDISKLLPGDYVLKVYLKDKGKIIAQANADFTIPEKPVWWGNKLGISDTPPPPWGPVKASGNTVSVWGREYKFADSPFPSRIINQGKPQLSSPINLKIVTDKGIVKWEENKVELISETPNQATFKTLNKSPLLDLSGRVAVEFDGFIRVDFTLLPKAPVTIKSLALEIPLKEEDALYMKAKEMFTDPNWGWYAAALYKGAKGNGRDLLKISNKWFFSAKGWLWPNKFMHYVWVGGDKVGLSVTFNSDKNFYTKKYVEILNKGKTKELRFNFIGSPYPLQEPLSYTLALHATPVKPLPKDPRKWHYGYGGGGDLRTQPGNQKDFYAVTPYRLTRAMGWPGLTPAGKRRVEAFWKEGVRVFPDYYTNMTTVEMPEFQLFGREWETIPKRRWPSGKFTTAVVCLRDSYTNFLLWGINKMIDEGLRGIYFDSSGVLACINGYHGCGYIDNTGRRRPTINLFGAREAYKRIYTLFKSRHPGSFIIAHAVPISPLASFVDGTTEGEFWGGRQKKYGYSQLTPDFFRTGFATFQEYGVPFEFYAFLAYNRVEKKWRVPAEEVLALTLIHNIYPLANRVGGGWGIGLQQLKPVWEIMDDWYTTSEWIPYWKSSSLVQSSMDNVKVSVYLKKAEKKALLLVANLANSQARGELKINLAGFGWKKEGVRVTRIKRAKFEVKNGILKEIKPMTKEAITLTDSAIEVSLPGKSIQFILLGKN